MIGFEHVTVTYDEALAAALTDVDLTINEGELVLVVGSTGSGKTTFLRAINGLVPHFTGGTLAGRVTVDGRDTRTHKPRDLADVVGFVMQDPRDGFVTDTVEDELAYTMESLGLGGDVMRRRVEETLDLISLADKRDRALLSLSGGERQRVAIGAALTAHPRILVLDEPTSALDPGAAEDVLSTLQRLVHDLNVTVVLAEHRLERVVQYADRVAVIRGGRVRIGEPVTMMADAPVAPPVVELGRALGWSPLPLSVRDARREAVGTRDQLASVAAAHLETTRVGTGAVVASTQRLAVRYGPRPALRGVSLELRAGETVALMGRNGAGKSTLLQTFVGLAKVTRGSVRVDGHDPTSLRAADLVTHVGLVPQDASDLLYSMTVADECADADRDAEVDAGSAFGLLDSFAPGIDPNSNPRDLSAGQRLALALAVVLVRGPNLVLLDEPTRGLDYTAKRRLIDTLRRLAEEGHAVVIATHDVEVAAEVADRTVMLADGEVVSDSSTVDAMLASPMFAAQTAKVMAPLRLLTVADVMRGLDLVGSSA